MREDDVVITGVGLLTAAGRGLDALCRVLQAGEGCARRYDTALPISRVAMVPEVPERDDFPDDRKAWLALAALDDALADAGWTPCAAPPERRAVFLGTGLSSVTPNELAEDIYPHLRVMPNGERGFDREAMARDLAPDRAAPRRHLPARVTEAVAERLDARGPVGTSFSACAAAAQAIAEGLRTLRRGEADVAFVGGHDSMVHPMGLLSFVVLGALAPEIARPFDRRRDGFLLGEGAAILVLERVGAARARGARVRARLVGAGTSVDAWNVTAPHAEGAGAERAMRRALADAGLSPESIDYVNAHGTGTPIGDMAEAKAVWRVFGSTVPVSSIKGAIGHAVAACGAVEAAACVGALEGGWLPGTFGYEEPDPACPVEVLGAPVRRPAEVVMTNSFGFGGQNCVLVLARADA